MLGLIRELVDLRSTYGYRRVTALLNKMLVKDSQGRVNHKCIYRIMKRNGLLLQRYTGRRSRIYTGQIITLHANTRRCSDAFTIQCWNGNKVFVAFSLDTCD